MRWATVIAIVACIGCNDLRDFHATWEGTRVGDSPVLRVGPGDGARLVVDKIDAHGITGRLSVSGLMPLSEFSSVPGVEADALANLTFAGAPLRVYLAFVSIPDGAGDGTLVIALYDDERIEVRLLRGGVRPLYAIFTLAIAPGGS